MMEKITWRKDEKNIYPLKKNTNNNHVTTAKFHYDYRPG